MIENVRMLNGLSRSWKLLALKFKKSPNEMRNVMPFPLMVGKSMLLKKSLTEKMAELLAENHMVDFVTSERVLYYRMPYCPPENMDFFGLKQLAEILQFSLGYQGEYRG